MKNRRLDLNSSINPPPPPFVPNPEQFAPIEGQEKLDKLADFGSQQLFRAKSIFPLDIFPQTIVIDLNKVSLFTTLPFSTARLHGFLIDDISDVFVSASWLSSTLEIVDRNFGENAVKIPNLRRPDAFTAKKIIQGLLIAKNRGVDFAQFDSIDNVRQQLIDLGSVPEGF